MPASKVSEIDLLLNKASLHQARLQELLGFARQGNAESPDDVELNRREDEMFKTEPEFAGLGSVQKDIAGDLKRKTLSSDEKLRKQLLGKSSSNNHKNVTQKNPKIHSKRSIDVQDDSSEGEGGRAASFKPKSGKKRTGSDSEEEHKVSGKGSKSYLDEVLEKKAKKKKRKKSRDHQIEGAE